MVDPQGDGQELKQNLHRYINNRIQDFAIYYQQYLPLPIQIEPVDAMASFMSLLRAVRQTPYRLYLLIDEYDNFANELMMGSRPTDIERYTALLYGEGSLKTVFKAIKAASAGEGVDRVFITGVSPVALSDITSGYNIAKDISLEPEFHDLCGFWEPEIANALTEIINAHHIPEAQIEETLMMMRTFYNGYCFSYQIAVPIYNPTLSLYFLEQFQKRQQYPRELLDRNLAMDRGKIAYISTLPHGNQIILNAVSEESPLSLERLAHRFGVEDMLNAAKDERFMVSLLYYFGVLTLAGQTTSGKLRFVIPNLVVKKLYIERIGELLLPASDRNDSLQTIERFYSNGEIQPVCEYIERCYFRVFDNRDYRWANELTLKTVFLTLLFNETFYMMVSETAAERQYADLLLLVRPDMRQFQLLDILLEFKYVSLPEVNLSGERIRNMPVDELRGLAVVRQKFAEARTALTAYQQALAQTHRHSLRLHAYSVVAVGFDRILWEEISAP